MEDEGRLERISVIISSGKSSRVISDVGDMRKQTSSRRTLTM